MAKPQSRNHRNLLQRDPYSLPLPVAVITGCLLATVFFWLLQRSPEQFDQLRRYCMGHWVSYLSVYLFSIGAVGLSIKWYCASHQSRMIQRAAVALQRLTQEGKQTPPANRVAWLSESWHAESESVRSSWLGGRLVELLGLLEGRGKRNHVEQDLKALADQAADHQHESYSLLRIIHWAMPMLGFLGTVLGISQTLGQLDTEALATEGQQAMNQLTAGLYVAFDTTATALVLTMISMFLQFGINRFELRLMQRIDGSVERTLVPFLSHDPFDAEDSLLSPVREMANDLVNCVRELVVEQASLWTKSITESQRQWSEWTEKLATEVDMNLVDAISQAMNKHLTGLEEVQERGGRQLEGRIQQWQTTLSEQTRTLHQHQKEMIQQTSTLHQLVQSTADLKKLEESISSNLRTIETEGNFQKASVRIETATQCVAEAVAMLATSLERAGLIRGTPQKPRVVRAAEAKSDAKPLAPSQQTPQTIAFPTLPTTDSVGSDPSTTQTDTSTASSNDASTTKLRGKAA